MSYLDMLPDDLLLIIWTHVHKHKQQRINQDIYLHVGPCPFKHDMDTLYKDVLWPHIKSTFFSPAGSRYWIWQMRKKP